MEACLPAGRDDANMAQTSLFDEWGYTYSVFVTSLDWDEEDICRFYDKRADVESHIPARPPRRKEARYDFSIHHISTQSFYANAADLELRLLAMNQITLFAKNVLRQSCPRFFASTIRRRCLSTSR